VIISFIISVQIFDTLGVGGCKHWGQGSRWASNIQCNIPQPDRSIM